MCFDHSLIGSLRLTYYHEVSQRSRGRGRGQLWEKTEDHAPLASQQSYRNNTAVFVLQLKFAVCAAWCYINTAFRGMVCTHNFFSYIFCGTSFNAFTHILVYYSFAVVLYIGPTIQNFLIERNFILLRGNFSNIISTKIVSSAYNFQNLIWYKKVIFNIYYRKIFP